jgi:hypothetical protein
VFDSFLRLLLIDNEYMYPMDRPVWFQRGQIAVLLTPVKYSTQLGPSYSAKTFLGKQRK